MIYLNEVANKISDLLNSEDNPADFVYDVQCVGFHLDRIYKKREGKNSLMVFVSSMGGSFNPVYGLGEATASIPVTIYFPVRFKESIFALDAYLHSVFVGASLDIGGNTGKVVSNLSVAQYGEIQDLDLREFKDWAESTYKRTLEVMEPYMSLQLTLYLSTLNDGYLYGNEARAALSFQVLSSTFVNLALGKTITAYRYAWKDADGYSAYQAIDGIYYFKNDKLYDSQFREMEGYSRPYPEGIHFSVIDLTFANGSLQSNSQSSDYQEMGGYESKGLPFSVSNGSSFSCYVGKSLDWVYLANLWLDARLDDLELDLGIYVESLAVSKAWKVYPQSINMPITKGQPLAITFAFAKRMG